MRCSAGSGRNSLLAEIDESELRDPHKGYSIVVFARHIYLAKDILFDRRFSDIIGRTDSGRWTIDYDRFHNLTE
ncbi:MAG TPA: hypothetical protein VFM97_03350 [Gammaproteobacteria bacterium]|nr:hypothetical protein [Gammaproteobacteria bacterium]